MQYDATSDADWEKLWLRQAEHGGVAGLPKVVALEIQSRLHGTSGAHAMLGALKFRRLVLSQLGKVAVGATFLDFGCGWGRHIRVFMKDFAPSCMTGVDINAENIALCREYLPGIRFMECLEGRPLDLSGNSIDVAISFSVFSHINEASAAFWLSELTRVLKPGGLLIVTSWGRALFDIFDRIRATGNIQLAWEGNIAHAFNDTDEVSRQYNAGEFVFGRHGHGSPGLDPDVYGISLMPRRWIEKNTELTVSQWFDDPKLVPQTTFFLKKN